MIEITKKSVSAVDRAAFGYRACRCGPAIFSENGPILQNPSNRIKGGVSIWLLSAAGKNQMAESVHWTEEFVTLYVKRTVTLLIRRDYVMERFTFAGTSRIFL